MHPKWIPAAWMLALVALGCEEEPTGPQPMEPLRVPASRRVEQPVPKPRKAETELLADDPAARLRAAEELAGQGDQGLTRLLELLDRVPADDTGARGVALRALEARLDGADSTTRVAIVSLLSRVGRPATPRLVRLLADSHPDVRFDAAEVLAAMDAVGDDVERAIVAKASDPDPRVRRLVVRFVAERRKADASAVLLEALSDPDLEVRRQAVHYIGTLPANPETVLAVADLLGHEQKVLAIEAATTLGRLGAGARPAFGALCRAARQGMPEVRCKATGALARVGEDEKKVVRVLVELLRADDAGVRLEAATELGRLQADEAKDALLGVVRDPEEELEVKGAAAQALGEVMGDELEGGG